MGRQIIRQPDGKFAIFCSIVDSLVAKDLTRRQVVERMDARAHAENVRFVRQTTTALVEGGKPYFQFTMTWDEAVASTKAAGYWED